MNLPKIPTPSSDPSGLVGAVGVFASAAFAALVVFGTLSETQAAALLDVVVSAVPLVIAAVAWAIRRRAFAPATVAQRIDRAIMLERNANGGIVRTETHGDGTVVTTQEPPTSGSNIEERP